jgi:hypothetical protein
MTKLRKPLAVLSEDGKYRWRLDRVISHKNGPVMSVTMVNPSTADANADDPTIRRLIVRAQMMGMFRLIVCNKFAFRATDVRALKKASDPVGKDNDYYLRQAYEEADVHFAAWGSLLKLPNELRSRWKDVYALAQECHVEFKCFGVNGDGHPSHPLMLSYNSPITKWVPPED